MYRAFFLALVALLTGCAGSQKLTVHHPTQRIYLDGKAVESGGEVRIWDADRLTVRVEETNTALYDYKVTSEPLASPDAAAVQGFGSAVGSYLSEALLALAGPSEAADVGVMRKELEDRGCRRLIQPFDSLQKLQDSLRVLEARALTTVMGFADSPTSARLARRARNDFADVDPPTKALVATLSSLAVPTDSQCAPFGDEVRQALDNGAKIVQRSVNLEKVVDALGTAQVYWEGTEAADEVDLGTISFSTGSTLTIQATPTGLAPLPLGATLPPLTVKVRALKKQFLYPSFALSLTYAPDATFPTYQAVETSDSTTVVREGDEKDFRVNYAANLGLQTSPICSIPHLGKLRLVPLQFLVSPTEGIRAIGVGTGIRVGAFRLDGGLQWFKRSYLDGQSVDEELTKQALRTQEHYGRPKPFVGFSFVGWKPFVP